MSLTLSRAGIEHVLIGEDREPPEIPRLGESLNDTASPELWQHFGREFPSFFALKSHISYFNGNFATLISLANPRRSLRRAMKFAPEKGTASYPWLGEGLFHLDRIGFDRAIYHKARKEPKCRFLAARVSHIEHDRATDTIARIDLADGTSVDRPRYVFDNTGFKSLVAEAAGVGQTLLGPPQRVVFSHYRRKDAEVCAKEWWRSGTNLIRLDRAFDGVDAFAWVIPIGRTLSVGMSLDADGERGAEDAASLMACLGEACRRRGVDFRPLYPEELPIQTLRHSYFVRDRAYGQNWLLVGGTYITIWFPSSAGLWTVTAACGMAERLMDEPKLGAHYDKIMRGLLPFHRLLDGVIHGPTWKSSFDVYRFFVRGVGFITGRIQNYLRIKHDNYGWFHPPSWFLGLLTILGRLFPLLVYLAIGGMALVRSRLVPERERQGGPIPLYFFTIPFRFVNFLRAIPQFLWALHPRKARQGLPAKDAPDVTGAEPPERAAG